MKQALLVTAYKNPAHLLKIVEHFGEDFSVYIHLDKKSRISDQELEPLKQHEKVRCLSRRYTTNWGGAAHLHCILYLMNQALQDGEAEYLHLISGHDFPIQSPAYFNDFLSRHYGAEFIETFPLPANVWENGGLDRMQYFHLHDWLDAKGKHARWLHKSLKLQKKLGFTRSLDFKGLALYGGSTWWSLSRACCSYIAHFLKTQPWFLKKFTYSFCAEEMVVQTILMNSPYRLKVAPSNLRHIVWEQRYGNIPAILDERELDTLKNSEHLFARRFEYPYSEALMKHLSKD